MPRILITRPRAAAESLAEELHRRGFETVIEPLLTIEPQATSAPALDHLSAVMITSSHALEAGQGLGAFYGLPCFCVGARTADRAKSAGFRDVHFATGDGRDLARLIDATFRKKGAGTVLHIAGQDIESGGQQELHRLGYDVHTWTVYAARPTESLSAVTRDLLASGKIDAIPVFSVRTAQILRGLLMLEDIEACCGGLAAIGLSDAVAAVLEGLPWRDLRVAATPTEDAVIDCLQQICPVPGIVS